MVPSLTPCVSFPHKGYKSDTLLSMGLRHILLFSSKYCRVFRLLVKRTTTMELYIYIYIYIYKPVIITLMNYFDIKFKCFSHHPNLYIYYYILNLGTLQLLTY